MKIFDKIKELRREKKYSEAHAALAQCFNLEKDQISEWDYAAWLHEKGLIFHAEGNYNQALFYLEKATEVEANNQKYWTDLGWCLRLLKHYQKAHNALDNALKIHPLDATTLYFKADILYLEGRHQEALSYIDKAIKIYPGIKPYWLDKASMLTALQRYEEAHIAVGKVLALDKNYSDAFAKKGLIYEAQGKPTKALACFERAIRLEPDNKRFLSHVARIYNLNGLTLFNQKNYKEALIWFEKAFIAEPTTAVYCGNKTATLRLLSRYDEALAAADKALAVNPNYAYAFNTKGLIFESQQMYDQAVNCFARAAELNVSDSSYQENKARASKLLAAQYNQKGMAYYKAKQYTEALDCFEKATTNNPVVDYYWSNKASILRLLSRYDEALAAADKTLAINPDYGYAVNQKGLIFEAQKNYDGALTCFAQAIRLEPNNKDYLIHAARIHNACGLVDYVQKKYADALNHFEEAILVSSSEAVYWVNKASALRLLSRHAEALIAADKALAVNPNYAYAFNTKGLIFESQQMYDQAVNCFARAAELNVSDSSYKENKARASKLLAAQYNQKGMAYYKAKQYTEALDCFEKATSTDATDTIYWENKASALLSLSRYNEAHAAVDGALAIAIYPNHVSALNQRGLIYETEKKYKEALNCFKTAIRIQPKDKQFLINAARLYNYNGSFKFNQKRYADALTYFEQATLADQSNAVYWGNKAKTLQKLSRYDEAYAAADTALTIDQDFAHALNIKGRILEKKEQYDAAILYFTKAIEINPHASSYQANKARVLRLLATQCNRKGMAYYKAKQYAEALDCFEKATTNNPVVDTYWSNKASTLRFLSRYEEALTAADKALAINPNHAHPLNEKGLIFETQKRHAEALSCFEKAFAIEPTNKAYEESKERVLVHLLNTSVAAGQLNVIKSLMEKYPSTFYQTDKLNCTALHKAIQSNQEEVAVFLAEQLPDDKLKSLIQLKIANSQTIVHLIAEKNLLKVADKLFNHNTRPASLIELTVEDLDCKDNNQKTPIAIASERGNKEMVDLLLKEGVSHVNIKGLERFDRSAVLAIQLRSLSASQERTNRALRAHLEKTQSSIDQLNGMAEKLFKFSTQSEANRSALIETCAQTMENTDKLSNLAQIIEFQHHYIQNLGYFLKDLYETLEKPIPSAQSLPFKYAPALKTFGITNNHTVTLLPPTISEKQSNDQGPRSNVME